MVEALVEWAEFIHEHGTEAAIARVDTKLAEREAAKDRAKLMNDQGDDVNHSDETHRRDQANDRSASGTHDTDTIIRCSSSIHRLRR